MQADKTMRDNILDAALELFARKGFEATSVRDIATAVGIKAPSLYKHFASKQEILDALVERELACHLQAAASLGMPKAGEGAPAAYAAADPAVVADFAAGLLRHWCTGRAAAFRRLLASERLRSPEMGKLYRELFLDGPLSYEPELFAEMMELGAMRVSDPVAVALQFWGPLLSLMEASDSGYAIEELEEKARQHVALFAKLNILGDERDE